MPTPNILKRPDAYITEYPTAIELAEQQEDVFWTAKEVALEKDLNDLHNNLDEAELHGVTTVLRLFTEYELKVGADYWLGRMMRIFKRPELQRMFASFGYMELNVHAPFYAKINELLGLNTKEFYNSYIQNPVLLSRMKSIDSEVGRKINNIEDVLISLGAFSIVEGAILYSSFAFLKHFRAEGKSKLTNLVAGINFSVRDENIHAVGGAWLFRQLMDEANLSDDEKIRIQDTLFRFADSVKQHEDKIVDMIFEKGKIEGITDVQLKHFVEHRINLCMQNLGFSPMYEVNYNPVGKWFYKSLKQGRLHDFFFLQGNEYNRDWTPSNFVW